MVSYCVGLLIQPRIIVASLLLQNLDPCISLPLQRLDLRVGLILQTIGVSIGLVLPLILQQLQLAPIPLAKLSLLPVAFILQDLQSAITATLHRCRHLPLAIGHRAARQAQPLQRRLLPGRHAGPA